MGKTEVMAVQCVIVDDNDHFLEAARDALERDGVQVVGVASSGAEAIARIGELRPDVTLVDVCLGEESGFALAERIAGASAADPSPVILVSTYAQTDFEEMIATSSALTFLSKSDLSGGAIREILETAASDPRP
jgi:DNA-binding NarL/FixJ family response regulator